MLLLQDNAPVQTAQIAIDEAANFSFESLLHVPYSLDLTPSDLFLFRKLISHQRVRHFENNDEVMCAVGEFSKDQDVVGEFLEEQDRKSILTGFENSIRNRIISMQRKMSPKRSLFNNYRFPRLSFNSKCTVCAPVQGLFFANCI